MVEIKLDHIYKKYAGNDNYSVTDFNLHIKDHEFIVFVGPSGCGKSTTIRMIAGLEDITDGELKMDGKVMNEIAPKDRDIAMVFQNYALYPNMTVYDNMAFSLKIQHVNKAEIKKRVANAAEILGLEAFLDRKPAALSGGQRQRVALGRAIVREAKLFLLDEPLSNLDAKLRVSMRAQIAQLHQRLKTNMIYVTHDQVEAMTMADRIVLTKQGEIQQVGTPSQLYNQPVNQFVAGFMGSPSMNFFEGELHENRFTTLDQQLTVTVTDQKLQKLRDAGYANQKVTMGIRAEDIHTGPDLLEKMADAKVQAKVDVAELLGVETMLYVTNGYQEFVAKVNAQNTHRPDEIITLAFDMNRAHFFDSQSQVTIA
ncbi:ABC transporter ATP-binding protein [Pediococcus cellicola]|uniref:Multiple sugar abc transporter, atp-binding protein n=1 Tax=Pediococcus cellicola TaxID=319652 RepID=A0A0R2IKI4_9LACO|nr:sn-glycerol-3-phosphate ABC transporter ATP-binding protein UgpC [Pediococcus cellicola]KRN65554.1 multiple sugar abc transporter, atp-binding protein [Pediococcus cellicola]GEL15594.1 sugar ABC transporter ATP-binding protein [Pediococcus cellicola]